MVRGMTLFKCDKCGKKFTALDVEYMASALSMPQPCPHCGGSHTMPAGLFNFLGKLNPQREIYKKIWEEIDKQR